IGSNGAHNFANLSSLRYTQDAPPRMVGVGRNGVYPVRDQRSYKVLWGLRSSPQTSLSGAEKPHPI
ncbi:MAG TPA: hypothetical protein DCL42_10685, partial [Deltaproteobacteria bacterium]|nr:hypothetical protein [Deltaproteobacteria bacterium]